MATENHICTHDNGARKETTMADWGYTRDEAHSEPKTGKQRCVVLNAEEAVSRAGNPMITITVQPSGSKAKVRTWIVKNDKFNRNMTAFFDAFPTIGEGNFDFATWSGALGAANFGTDENGYLKVKWFLRPDEVTELPDFVGDKPVQQTVTHFEPIGEDEDLPF